MKKHPTAARARWISVLCAVGSIALFLCLWQYGATYTRLNRFLPGPIVVIPRFLQSFTKEIGVRTMGGHIWASLLRVLAGFGLASVTGIVLGVSMGMFRGVNAALKPFIEVMRPIPGIAWIPISILWFGLGETSKVFVIFISTVSIVTVNAYAGAVAVDPVLVGAARMLGASKAQVFFTIILPASVPQIFTGLQTGLSISWMVVLAAEMIRSEYGVGWVITAGSNTANMSQVLVGVIAIGIVGMVMANLLRLAERKLCIWKGGD